MANKLLTLALLKNSSRILLGYKKRGFGQGLWNGFGGKVQSGETIAAAARREMLEECGLDVPDLQEVGRLMFEFQGDPTLLEVHVFTASECKEGQEPQESDEMRPEWFDIDAIPFKKMWADDYLWFPLMLADKRFYGYFLFQGQETILDYYLTQVSDINSIEIPNGPLGKLDIYKQREGGGDE